MPIAELLLADGRFPGGSFAHSGGLEAAVAEGAVHDVASLRSFAAGRLWTAGPLEGWLAAQACRAWSGADSARLTALEAEADAHQPSPALRAASRAQGRGLRRTAALVYPALESATVEVQPIVVGVLAAAGGLGPFEAARIAVSGCLMTALSAAPKLMALDMADAMAIALELSTDADAIVASVVDATDAPLRSAPLTELRAERHVTWEVRLFVS